MKTTHANKKLENLTHLLSKQAFALFGLNPAYQMRLLNHSENMTYCIEDTHGKKRILRIHREGYQTYETILSEITWMKALQQDLGILTPQALKGSNGHFIQQMAIPQMGSRYCVLMEWIEGEMPQENGTLADLLEPFTQLGQITAHFHQHALTWNPPASFQRQCWDFEGTLGNHPIWGNYWEGEGLSPTEKKLLNHCAGVIQNRLEQFGKSSERFGLIHADLRLANLLIHQGNIRVIDFDDCGWGWFLYDIGAALSFMEERKDLPELIKAWVQGYLKVGSLSQEEINEIPTFIMLRRLTLLGWAASRRQTGGFASKLGIPFSKGTCHLAQSYLEQGLSSGK